MARFCRPNKTSGQNSRHPFFLVIVPFVERTGTVFLSGRSPLELSRAHTALCHPEWLSRTRHAETEPCLTKKAIRLLRLARVLSGMHMSWEPWVMLKPMVILLQCRSLSSWLWVSSSLASIQQSGLGAPFKPISLVSVSHILLRSWTPFSSLSLL